ncbi:D-alanyl-D-alanine carboxypeptidase (penicillin-binding protein 5/6) [Salinibacillus kushneri]|uniref:serine-type D-Ala-D-Ala carboxypeptidase n=1 Tax=Salinibacillus kushneri TaxID=237682 RepID=A0A1I0HWP7_9BACI|nr:D-alanyl-D-alanine carboxypeptidase family protein [Salinibacillus kushneri]SET88569.1 D-alanyl-D-alanine carboxypeptidase (penicillin-binding protein 5/6) [Salinibacillus kushneri]
MRKLATMLLIFCLLTSTMVLPVYAKETEQADVDLAENSKSAILLEKDTGEILYEKNTDERLPPASMTKVMTMILIMEALESGQIKLKDKVRISEHAASMGGSQIFLEEGEEMTVDNLLKGVAVASGNDASVALAERIAGSEKAFVKQMNKKVKELGLNDTQFKNTTGLPAKGHYSTAHDMAMMAKELLKHEKITEYTSIYDDYLRKGTEDEFWLVNTNKLVKFYKGVDGLKTGYTSEAKYCLTATAKRDNMRVIAVAMGADSTKKRNQDITTMLDYAFQQYDTKPVYDRFDQVDEMKMFKANQEKIKVVTGDKVSILTKKGEEVDDLKQVIEYRENLSVPMKKGEEIGTLKLVNKGKVLSETPLIVNQDIKEAGVWTLLKRSMKKFYNSY